MDVFGHVALSVLIGRSVAPGPELRRVTTAGALSGGLLPDVDAVSYLWGAEVFARVHQVYTHNVVALLVLPALVAGVGGLLGVDRRALFVATFAGMAGHLVGDVIGLWPVPLLLPFSDARVAFFLLEQDFSLGLDLVLVLGAELMFWDPIADSARRTRLLAGGTLVLGAVAVAVT